MIYVFTHDSIAVGQDGPTHQPIEQLTSLRCMPRLSVIRPADANEVVAAWKVGLQNKEKPTVLVLSRQDLPILEGTSELAKDGVARGAYVVSKAHGHVDAILMGSGSEVHLLIEAQRLLEEKGIEVSVVSFPSWDLFEAQPEDYRNEVILKKVRVRIAVEMGATTGWHKYVGDNGLVIGIDDFGISGNGSEIIEKYGFTAERIVSKVEEMIS